MPDFLEKILRIINAHVSDPLGHRWSDLFDFLQNSRILIFRPAFLDLIQFASAESWHTLWDCGFGDAIGNHIQHKVFCGLTQTELVHARQDGDSVLHIIFMLQIFSTCLWRAAGDDPMSWPSVQNFARRAGDFEDVWKRLWDLQEPFLVSESVKNARTCSGHTDHAQTLHGILLECLIGNARMRARYLGLSITSIPRNSRLPHLLLLIWVHSSVASSIRLDPLRCVLSYVNDIDWQEQLFAEATSSGQLSEDDIHRALIRDLKDETYVDAELYNIMTTAMIYRRGWKLGTPIILNSPLERQLFWGCVAGMRRQFCRGNAACTVTDVTFAALYNIIRGVFAAPTENHDLCISETKAYGLVGLVAMILIKFKDAQDKRPTAEGLRIVIFRLLSALPRAGQAGTNPKVLAARQQANVLWRKAITAANGQRADVRWERSTIDLWKRVGQRIESTDEQSVISAFPPLKRCAWIECLCSVHKPIHSLKVCKGCERVAYCSEQCQESDWKCGKHKGVCDGRFLR